jgi:hypothetical protein
MKLLNIKATLILTLSTIFMVSSVFADIGLENKDKPLIDIESVQNAKKEATYKAPQGEEPTSIVSEVHPDYDPGLRSTDVNISCDGGSWQSEVSWQIYDPVGALVAEGGAPFAGDASLDDGVYSVDGQDAYGDGWNGNYLSVTGTDGTPYLNWTVEGAGGSTTFEISSTAVYGCTDPGALNYNQNCAGEDVEATHDDGCCEYPTPANDDCADAEPVTSYPTEITSSSENATVDCEGYLNWNAVWYELALPYDYNLIDIVVQAEGAITNAGIVIMDDCNCDDFIGMGYAWDGANGWINLYSTTAVSGPDNNGTILYPLFLDPQQGYTVTFNVVEEIWGCTDPNASNYNPDATNDDGSCTYDDCTTAWDLRMFMYDSYGDGWNGNVYTITDFSSGEVLYSGTLATGTEGVSTPICLEDGNYGMTCDGGSFQGEVSWELNHNDGSGTVLAGGAPYSGSFTLGESDDVLGCTDATACNYNPDATIDDGSCVYEGDDCTCAYDGGSPVNGDPIYGATTEALDADWYSFVVDQDYDNLSVSLCGSGFDTKLEVWGACDDATYLGYNDDAPCGNFHSQVDLTFVTAGTYHAKVFGFGSAFGDYVMTITGSANPTGPVLTANGIPGAVSLSWEAVPTPDRAPAPGQTTLVYSAPNRAEKNEALDPVPAMINPDFMNNRSTDVTIVCDGGAWQSEVSWEILTAAGDMVASGGAPFSDVASLDDGVYTVNGTDAYGDGWNGNYLSVTGTDGTPYLNWTVEGAGGSTTFEISSTAVYGCTDPAYPNYGYNCAGDYVGEPTIDDGCCAFPPPDNDNCEDAELVEGPYPVEITGTNADATVDCEGVLNWDAVWYELTLPYSANNVDVYVQADGPISNAGIILTSDCSCDPASFIYSSGFSWDPAGGWLNVWFDGVNGADNNGTILHPLFIADPQGYTVTYTVTELYLPTYNLYRDGSEIASGISGNAYIDSDVTEDVQYCYTIEQILPDGSLSDMSNEACATPTGSVGGETVDDPIVIGGLPFTAFGSTEFYYDNYDESCPYTGSLSPDVVYSYTATEDGTIDIDLCGEGTYYDTKTYVYENEAGNLVGCNDDACNNSHNSFLSQILGQPVFAGNTYYIVIDGYASQFGEYELNITGSGGGDCVDDEFEDDDTKDTATDHGGDGSFGYALCMEDNPDGIEQPGGFSAVDWSVVTVAPWTSLTAATVGDPTDENDIDLWIEDYAGDGICAWGGDDDLAGSGNAFSEEEATWVNLSDDAATVYVGAIYFAGSNPINYTLSLSSAAVANPDAPQNVTATLSAAQNAILVAWDPPYVDPSSRIAEAKLTNKGHTKKVLPGKYKEGYDRTLRSPEWYEQERAEANRLRKFQRLESMHANATPISSWTLQDYKNHTPASRHNGLMSDPLYDPPGNRDTDVTIEVCIDNYPGEGSWNVWDYQNNLYLLDDQFFSEGYECQTQVLPLPDGDYSVECWDSYGDGGQTVVVSVGGEIIAEGVMPYDTYFSLAFTVGGGVPGCTDDAACNYNPDATEDDGTCCIDKCLTMNMIDAYGDGWNGATYTISNAAGDTVASGGLTSGSEGSDALCLGDGDYTIVVGGGSWDSEISWNITDDETGEIIAQGVAGESSFTVGGASQEFGCTDPNACNYDPDATEDDGSCVLPGEACDCSNVAVLGANEATGEDEWFEYTTATDCQLEVTSQNETGDAQWDTDLYLLGSCDIGDDGIYSDQLGNNDDCCGYYGPSTVVVNLAAGTNVKIFWSSVWGPGPFTFQVNENEPGEDCVDDSYEDNDNDGVENDSYTTPEAIAEGSYDLQMCMGDADWYSITVNNGESLHATLTDINETGLMDLGLFALEIDPAYALCYVSEQNYLECEFANTLDHPVEFLIAARDYYGEAEGPYTLTVELITFEQMTYTVSRSSNGGDYVELASGLLAQEYMDEDVVPGGGDNHCYTVSATLSGNTGPESEPPACVEMEFVEPPAPPTDFAAEGLMFDSDGDGEGDTPAVNWTWEHEGGGEGGSYDLTILMWDAYGDGWNGNVLDIGGNAFTIETGDYAEGSLTLDAGTYPVSCGGGSWESEVSWEILGADGSLLLSGGAPFDGELVLGGGGGGSFDLLVQMWDAYGDGWNGNVLNIGGNEFTIETGDYAEGTLTLDAGTYEVICGGGSWQSEVSWTISDVNAGELLSGGAPFAGELVLGSRDSGISVFNLADGQNQSDDMESRDITFELCFEYFGTPYCFATPNHEILVYGFVEGDEVCGEVAAVDDGWYSEWVGPACAMAGGGPSTVDITVDHAEGWNMVSLPVGVEDSSPGALFSGSIGGTLYSYPYGDPEEALALGAGYWLRFESDGSDVLSGDPVDNVTVSLSEGWNMIGSVSGAAMLDDPSGIVIAGTMYGYPYGDPATVIEPGSGYWVRASADGDVTISSGAGSAKTIEKIVDANTLRFNDTQTLYFGIKVADESRLSYSLPPMPPKGAFDVRFAGGWKIAENDGTIEVMNNTDRLSIDYDITIPAGEQMRWVLTGNNTEYELKGTGTIEVIGNASDFVLAKVPVVPEAYVLSQNYPNPFNPVTNISYGLPKESFVTITVYNIMGQKVTELVNDVRHAGYHTVVWNSANLAGEPVSSGVYVYMITAGDYHAVKKMILMK